MRASTWLRATDNTGAEITGAETAAAALGTTGVTAPSGRSAEVAAAGSAGEAWLRTISVPGRSSAPAGARDVPSAASAGWDAVLPEAVRRLSAPARASVCALEPEAASLA